MITYAYMFGGKLSNKFIIELESTICLLILILYHKYYFFHLYLVKVIF